MLSDEERSQLQSFARGRSLSAALSHRARIVLSSAGISMSSVARGFQRIGLQPPRIEGFNRLNDPLFIEKLRYGVGPYHSPSDNVRISCRSYASSTRLCRRS